MTHAAVTLTPRRYADQGLEETLAAIRREVAEDGRSEGWSGDAETLAALREALAADGIRYVDDLRGRWESEPR